MALVSHRTQTGLNAAHPPFYASESDPTTTLGAYRGWFKPSTGEAWIRNAANTDWIAITGTGGGSVGAASEGSAGIAEIATQTEVDTGADDGRIVTPLKAATRYLAKAGGTLTGFLTLHADPSSAMHPVTKQYADGLVASGTPDATETTKGKAELATQTEVNTGTDDTRIVTPLKLATRTATDTRPGVVELATDAEVQTGTDTARAITPANLSARSATETRSGVAEVATQTETDTGTDDGRIVTPLKAATRYLAKAGGTLTGFLTLHADPTSAMHAVTKQYADGLSGATPDASETTKGKAELATQAETNAGTDDTRIVTPLKLANYSGLGGGSGYRTLVTLGSDVVTTSTSYADVTGLSFAVTSGVIYRFYALIIYSAGNTGQGSLWSVNGPASPTLLGYRSYTPTAASGTVEHNINVYDDSATAAPTSAVVDGNIAEITGVIQPSSSGTFAIRFKAETSATITAKAGSTLEWW